MFWWVINLFLPFRHSGLDNFRTFCLSLLWYLDYCIQSLIHQYHSSINIIFPTSCIRSIDYMLYRINFVYISVFINNTFLYTIKANVFYCRSNGKMFHALHSYITERSALDNQKSSQFWHLGRERILTTNFPFVIW